VSVDTLRYFAVPLSALPRWLSYGGWQSCGCACQGAAAQHATLRGHHECTGQQGMGVPTLPLRLVLVLQRVAAGHFKEAGWNGIEFTQATNCWASNVGCPAACAEVQHHTLHHASLHTCLLYSTLPQLDWQPAVPVQHTRGHNSVHAPAHNHPCSWCLFRCYVAVLLTGNATPHTLHGPITNLCLALCCTYIPAQLVLANADTYLSVYQSSFCTIDNVQLIKWV
jgi:hypothetical protein